MGFEIPIDSGFPGHRKTVDLKTRLKDKQGDIWPLRLWFWAAVNARDGVIRVHPHTLEAAIGWPGDKKNPPGRLFQALKKSGFIEADGKTIHDWMEGIGRAIFLYECKKQKQREKYAQKEGFPHSSGRIPSTLDTRSEKDKKSYAPPARAAATALPTPAAALPDSLPDKPKTVDELVAEADAMTPAAAAWTLSHGGEPPFPEVKEALQKRAAQA